MPTYEYECKSCGYTFEAFQNISDEPLCECPKCGGEIYRVIHGGTGIIFKGSGWYVTDYTKSKNPSINSDKSVSEGQPKKVESEEEGESKTTKSEDK